MNKIDEIMAQVLTTLQMGNEFTESGHTFGFKQFVTELTKLRVMIEDALKVPDGWQLVPIICTPEIEAVYSNDAGAYQTAQELHDAMLSAAPKQEEV